MSNTKTGRIFLSPPSVGAKERAAVKRAFDSGYVAPCGPQVDEFERRLAALAGPNHAEEVSKEKTHDFSKTGNNIKAEITHILYHLMESSRYIKRILSCESGEIFMRYFKERLTQVFEGELEKQESDIPTEYMLNHMVCDFAETVRWWMNNDRYSPEDISAFFFSTTLSLG